jgi:hypothetical protein
MTKKGAVVITTKRVRHDRRGRPVEYARAALRKWKLQKQQQQQKQRQSNKVKADLTNV